MSELPIQRLRPEVVLDELFNEQEHVATGIHELDGVVPTQLGAVVAPDGRDSEPRTSHG